MVNKIPKFIKLIYRNRERLWLRVVKVEGNFYLGHIDNIPVSKAIQKGQYVKVNKNKVIDSQ